MTLTRAELVRAPTGMSFLKVLAVGLVMVLVLAAVVVVVVVTSVLGWPGCGGLRLAGCCDWVWA